MAASATANPRVVAAAPFVNAQGMLTFDGGVRGSLIRGILPEREDAGGGDRPAHEGAARWLRCKPGEFGIVLGAELARALAVHRGRQGRR